MFVRSGLRYDYIMSDKNDAFFRELVEHHISGQLKVAPEHMSDNALYYMGKPSFKVYEAVPRAVCRINEKLGRKQYLVPYLMKRSHPGATAMTPSCSRNTSTASATCPSRCRIFTRRRERCPPRCTTPRLIHAP